MWATESADLAFRIYGREEEPQGACCYGDADELCIETTQDDCVNNLLGDYMGDGTFCEGMEACCLPIDRGTGCVDADALCCRDLIGGTPQGAQTTCQPDEACCLPNGLCVDVDPLCCVTELDGIPQGPGTGCTAEEACCLGDGAGTCIMVDPLCCDEQNGTPQGLGTECTALEACCVGEACLMVDPLCCDELDGVPQGIGTECTISEACCLPNGDCVDVDPLCCDDLGGTLAGAPACLGDANGDGLDDACEPPGMKWVQMPDLTPNGIDVEAMFWTPDQGILLADDFLCTESGKITEIRVWGSWYNDFFWPTPDSARFHLSFHADDPSGPGGWSQPIDPPLWLYTFEPGSYFVEPYATDLVEGFYEAWPPPGFYDPEGDTICWLYTFPVPEGQEFFQTGTDAAPVVYWLDVQADPMSVGAEGAFGWKTSTRHWNDDAVWAYGTELVHEPWFELIYPEQHPLHPQSIDLAFMLIQEPGSPVKRPMPEPCGAPCVGGTDPCVTDADCLNQSICVPPPTGEPGGGVCYAPKHRYLSIVRNPAQAPNTARRVCTTGFCLGWVGTPYTNAGLQLADVVPAPVYAGIDFPGDWPNVLHVSDCEIATGTTYEIEAILHGDDLADPTSYSEALVLITPTKWGDVVGTCPADVCQPPQGTANLDDIMAKIKRFQAIPVAPLTWLDDDPSTGDLSPNQTINLGDIMNSVYGFQGQPYPGNGPMGCTTIAGP
jgi:hypothetical protein